MHRLLLRCLLGAALSLAVTGLWLGVAALSGHAVSPWEMPLAAAMGGMLAYAFALRQERRPLADLARLAYGLREGPAETLIESARSQLADTHLADLWEEIEALSAESRRALAALAEADRKLQRSSADFSISMDRKFLEPTHVVVGSSRQRLVARLGATFNIVAATEALCSFLGETTDTLLGRPLSRFIHADDRQALGRAMLEAVRDGEAHGVGVRTSDGKRHVTLDIMARYDEDGRPTHLRCHILDVSQRVHGERELIRITQEVSEANGRLRAANTDLERLKESYRDLYHFAPVLYFSLDAQGRFVAFNETTLRVLGYTREALLGRPYIVLLPQSARSGFDLATLQRPGEIESQWVKSDGTVIDVWIGTTVIRDEHGAFVRSRSAARDVTETRRLSNAVRVKADELTRAVTELKRINQELEEFTYVVSHDLKEPLRTLEAFSNFLVEDYGDKLTGEGQEYISHIVQASRRMGRLIDDLLTLSRTGRVINSPRHFEWAPAVAGVLRDLHGLIQRKNARVTVESELPACLGDPERVSQLLANLIGNGLKYNPGPTPEVAIGARPVRAGDTHGVLWVRDNGVGIDPRHHEQIFRIFRRLHRHDEVEGTGAGLAICKRIVEAHGGRIWVESRPGEGATFLFTLPLARREQPREDARAPALAAR
jgi:PAS domain S-box-containing protein